MQFLMIKSIVNTTKNKYCIATKQNPIFNILVKSIW